MYERGNDREIERENYFILASQCVFFSTHCYGEVWAGHVAGLGGLEVRMKF
jgi:hypothetical protein